MNATPDPAAITAFMADPSLDSFLQTINDHIGRDGETAPPLGGGSNPSRECDSLELVSLSLYLETLGAEVPPGMEASIDSLADLHQHVMRRVGLIQ